ncbi:MAG: hypothetical protein HYY17_00695 [Planctomycetes bacterium]|nr:hypothetical protein [Planctomycetota bacterium]
MRRSCGLDLLFLFIGVPILAALVIPATSRSIRNSKQTGCSNCMAQMWRMMGNYQVQFGGPQKRMPHETGDAFWLKLSGPNVRLIDASLSDIYQCPVEGVDDPGCDFRGPAADVNSAAPADGDPVGADVDGNHGVGEGGNVIRKSGDVQTCAAGDPLWARAAVTTTGGNPAVPPEVSWKWPRWRWLSWLAGGMLGLMLLTALVRALVRAGGGEGRITFWIAFVGLAIATLAGFVDCDRAIR